MLSDIYLTVQLRVKSWEHKLLIYLINRGKEIKTYPSEINQKAFFLSLAVFAEALWTTFQKKKWNMKQSAAYLSPLSAPSFVLR